MRLPAHADHHTRYSSERGSLSSPQMSSQIQNLLVRILQDKISPSNAECLPLERWLQLSQDLQEAPWWVVRVRKDGPLPVLLPRPVEQNTAFE